MNNLESTLSVVMTLTVCQPYSNRRLNGTFPPGTCTVCGIVLTIYRKLLNFQPLINVSHDFKTERQIIAEKWVIPLKLMFEIG